MDIDNADTRLQNGFKNISIYSALTPNCPDKFKHRLIKTIKNLGIDVINLNIRKLKRFEYGSVFGDINLQKRFVEQTIWILLEFNCPCGEIRREFIPFDANLWKCNFSKIENIVNRALINHLKSENLL